MIKIKLRVARKRARRPFLFGTFAGAFIMTFLSVCSAEQAGAPAFVMALTSAGYLAMFLAVNHEDRFFAASEENMD